MYIQTNTILDKILAQKVDEIAVRKENTTLKQITSLSRVACPVRSMPAALKRDTVALIAEVKKASPSKGVLIEDFDPAALASTYAANGAAAISVLTDEMFFQGSLDDLKTVRGIIKVPVLRKDFIIDEYQVYETRAAEADALLLIVAALDEAQLADLHALTLQLGMTPLVEVHDENEMERALKLGANLIGINNRDLRTFETDLETTARLASLVPDDVVLVAESGIRNGDDVRRMGELGAHAVLVGEHLVKSDDISASVREFSSQQRH